MTIETMREKIAAFKQQQAQALAQANACAGAVGAYEEMLADALAQERDTKSAPVQDS